ncbi:MAG: alpha/beta fold hydrolase [candidate division FCPU426 bacterium]
MNPSAVGFESGACGLKGILHLPEARVPGPGFVCLHGLTLDHSQFSGLAEMAADAGVACLRFNMRGHGDSGGKLEEQGFEDQVTDAAAALDFLAARPEIDPARVGLLGFSLGGAVAAVLSRRKAFKALALWGSLLDTKSWTRLRIKFYGEPVDGILKIWDQIPVSERLFSEAIATDPFADALAFPGPLFAAHGGRDRNHPPEKSAELVAERRALGLPTESFFPEASGHKFLNEPDHGQLLEKTLAFFKASL